MPEYDQLRFSPPAPVAAVTLRTLDASNEIENVPMLLDTGADITLIPANTIARLGLQPKADRQYELASFDGTTSFASAVELALVFEGKIFRDQFLLTESAHGILGRNLLNSLPIFFNGPSLSWAVQAPSSHA